jgi:hypothetical protein
MLVLQSSVLFAFPSDSFFIPCPIFVYDIADPNFPMIGAFFVSGFYSFSSTSGIYWKFGSSCGFCMTEELDDIKALSFYFGDRCSFNFALIHSSGLSLWKLSFVEWESRAAAAFLFF